MPKLFHRRRYVAPHLKAAKALADQCGEEYINAWRRPYQLMAQEMMLEIFLRTCPVDCSEDIAALTTAIEAAKVEVPLARQRLVEARLQFHLRKANSIT